MQTHELLDQPLLIFEQLVYPGILAGEHPDCDDQVRSAGDQGGERRCNGGIH